MSKREIAASDPHPRRRIPVLDTEMAYVELGTGKPVVFLHGNPTSSYLWRNIMPHVAPIGRCLAPDLVGMGDSGDMPGGGYRYVDHRRYVDAWLEAVGATQDVTFVIHDWGSVLGFDWAYRHPGRTRALVYMEAILTTFSWDDFPEAPNEKYSSRQAFRDMRSSRGEKLILEDNYFVEERLPARTLRKLGEEEMAVYRRRFKAPGASRLPTLVWPREVPIGGEPADVVTIVEAYRKWLQSTPVPKLFVRGEPGGLLRGKFIDLCRSFPNQEEIAVPGIHYLQEDAPHEIGAAIAAFLGRLP